MLGRRICPNCNTKRPPKVTTKPAQLALSVTWVCVNCNYTVQKYMTSKQLSWLQDK